MLVIGQWMPTLFTHISFLVDRLSTRTEVFLGWETLLFEEKNHCAQEYRPRQTHSEARRSGLKPEVKIAVSPHLQRLRLQMAGLSAPRPNVQDRGITHTRAEQQMIGLTPRQTPSSQLDRAAEFSLLKSEV
ncbi:Golgi Membrane Protein 1 [Manis pentadactyla]|nr:Golgi Membrane Protein 1 [Manis pentadactyla]